MTDLITYLQQLIGSTEGFWHTFSSNNNYATWNWDYGMLFEYFVAGVIVCIVIANAFKFLRALIS